MNNGKDIRKAQKAIKAGKPVSNPYKDDVIYSNLGQWKYPGQVTRIPSNQITMQGVPYPVQGIDDTGYSQMMYPGMDYQFPGNYVTEYPQMQIGGLIKKGLSAAKKVVKQELPNTKRLWRIENPNIKFDPSKVANGNAQQQHLGNWFSDDINYVSNYLRKNQKVPGSRLVEVNVPESELSKYHISNYENMKDVEPRNWLIPNDAFRNYTDLSHLPISGGNLSKIKENQNYIKELVNKKIAEKRYGGDPSLTNIEGHYPFGGQNTKTHTHMANGGWLDQYQPGGRTPIYVSDKNDPRYKAYNDSLEMYNRGENEYKAAIIDAYKNLRDGESILNLDDRKYNPRQKDFDNQYGFIPERRMRVGTYNKNKPVKETERSSVVERFKKPVQPVVYKKSEEEIPWIEPKVKSNKVWGKNDVTDEYYKRFIKKYPGAMGLDPNKVDKDGMHAPVYPKVEKKKETINPDYLPMIQASMPEMISREPEIIIPSTLRPSNTNNRIAWRMDPETRKMVPVYLEGRKQKVKKGKRLYNEYIPTSTMAIPEDFEPQFDRPELVEKTDPYWRREYVKPKNVATKQMGGWLDTMQVGGNKNMYIPYIHNTPYKDVVETWEDNSIPIDENLLTRQQYKESTFNPKAVSPKNARGLAQIMPDVEKDAIKAGVIKKGQSIYDPEVNKKIQKWYMDNLYNANFINKPGVQQDDSVKLAKTLAAYNWGRGNLKKYLGEQKQKGIDIYNSYDWTKNLPKETLDYVNAILLKKNPTFEKNYNKAIENYEFKKGGGVNPLMRSRSKRNKTSKNIQSSINKIFLRNKDLFGPGGKNIYDPKSKYQDGGEGTLNEDQQFLINMANSPLFNERYAKMVGQNMPIPYKKDFEESSYNLNYPADQYKKDIINNITSVKYAPQGEGDFSEKNGIKPVAYYSNNISKHQLEDLQEKIKMWKKYKFDISDIENAIKHPHTIFTSKDENNPYTRTHETSHASTEGILNPVYPYKAENRNPYLRYVNQNPSFKKYHQPYYDNPNIQKYLSEPTEIKARVDAARKYMMDNNLYNPINKKFTSNDYEKLLFSKEEDIKDLIHNYSEEDIIRMFNEMVTNNPKAQPVAKMGGIVSKYQVGGNKIDMSKVKMDYFPKSQADAQSMLDYEKFYYNQLDRELENEKQKYVAAAVKKGVPKKLAEAQVHEMLNYQEGKNQGSFQEYEPQGKLSKTIEVLANPMLAMKNYRGGRLPDYFSTNEEEDFLSPTNVSNMGYQFLTSLGNFGWGLQSADAVDRDLKNNDYQSAAIDAAFSLPALKQAKKWQKELNTIDKAQKAATKSKPIPRGKMEGLGTVKDASPNVYKSGIKYPFDYGDLSTAVREGKYPATSPHGSAKGDYFDIYQTGYTDVPAFNKQVKDLMTQAQFGKRPLTKNVEVDRNVSKNALMEALDDARYEEGLTTLIPAQYMKQAKIPYNAKKAFKNIQPNKYGGGLEQAQFGKLVKAGLRNQTIDDAVKVIKNKIAQQKVDTYNALQKLKADRPKPSIGQNKFLSGERKYSKEERDFISKNPPTSSGYYNKPSDPYYLFDFKVNPARPLEEIVAPYKKKHGGWLDYLD